MNRMPPVNPDLADTGSPPIPEARGWLAAYGGRCGAALDLSQAVPGYPPPPELLQWLAAAARDREAASYGPIPGDDALTAAYARHLSALYGASITPGEIAITAGCNQAFVVVMMALARAGDAVLLPTPWYFNHAMTLGMLGIEARPLPATAAAGFVPSPEDALRRIDARTRAIVLVTPNNPTGAIYPPATIAAFAHLAEQHGLWLVLDETYRDFLPGAHGAPHGLFGAAGRRSNVISLYSFSKSYCIPGHRLGAVTAPAPFLTELAKVVDCVQICAPRIGQMALVHAIPALAAWREGNRELIEARARAFRDAMALAPDWRVESLGGYFAYLRHPFAGAKAADVARALASRHGLLVLPGSYFGPGQEDHVRVAFANVDEAAIRDFGRRLAAVAALNS